MTSVATAIAIVLDAHQGDLENTAAMMFDYLDDDADHDEHMPRVTEAMEIILDACQIVEARDYLTLCDVLAKHNTALADAFADTAELCRTCHADYDVCDEHGDTEDAADVYLMT